MRRNGNWKVKKAVMMLLLVIVGVLVFGYGTELLWNWLMPAIFGLRAITFAQAIGLVVLSKILLGGFGGRGGRGRWGRAGGRWKEGMKERWEQMTPEERERFRAGMRGRGGWCSDWSGREGQRAADQQAAAQAAEQKGV